MNRTEIHAIFRRHVSGETLDRALKQLESMGLASCQTIRSDGRSTEMWFAK